MNKMVKSTAVFALLIVLSAVSFIAVAADTIRPGDYSQEGGWGTLTVSPPSKDGQPFSLSSFGPNAHTCEMDGIIKNRKAVLDVGEAEKKCVIHFQASKQGIDVTVKESEHDQCRQFCGIRAWFTGLYLIPAKGCAQTELASVRKRFISLYRKKDYSSARMQLEPVLHNCGKTVHTFEDGDIRNDLAITLYHLKDYAGCLKTLEPLKQYAHMTSEQLKEEFPPTDADVMESIAKAARTNIRLCSTKLNGK